MQRRNRNVGVDRPAINEAYKFLRAEVRRRGGSRAELARKIGWDPSTLTHALNDHDGGIRSIQKIAKALGYEATVKINFKRSRKARVFKHKVPLR